ncbi:hypothetical protein G6F60_013861 [Rhizopus arrhizus]|nr:hypothetical protein G6F60_013861 [Rhizopus arrhizus]
MANPRAADPARACARRGSHDPLGQRSRVLRRLRRLSRSPGGLTRRPFSLTSADPRNPHVRQRYRSDPRLEAGAYALPA